MRLHRPSASRLVALAIVSLVALAGPARADDDTASGWPRVVLVLDASGSMWAKLEGRTRIQVARDAIRDLIGDWDPRLELGLIAYGHRSRHDCSDIETLLPIGPVDPSGLIAAVDGIRPVGMTPLADSLEHAARLLESDRRPATVILVSDGNETCGRDPCAVARALSGTGVDFTAHVIGFDVTADERVQLQCVADATGGLFIDADGAAGLSSALRAALDDIARRATSPPLWLAASLAPDSAPLDDPVDWRISPLDAKGHVGPPEVEAHAATLARRLRGGRYRVEASIDGVHASEDLSVDPMAHASHVLSLEAANLRVAAIDRDDQPLEGGVTWRIDRAETDADAREREEGDGVVVEREAVATRFLLSEGRYEVTAFHDGDHVTRLLVVRPGQMLRKSFQFGIGRLALRAVMAEGRQPVQEPVHWQIRNARGELLSDEVRSSTLRTLDTGPYSVVARRGEASTRRDVEVRSGVTTIETLDLEAGELGLYGVLPAPGAAIYSPIDWKLEAPDGSVHVVSAASPRVVLPAGTYSILGSRGGRRGESTVEVRAGSESTLGIVLREPETPVAGIAP